jgi:hypothetical protein
MRIVAVTAGLAPQRFCFIKTHFFNHCPALAESLASMTVVGVTCRAFADEDIAFRLAAGREREDQEQEI